MPFDPATLANLLPELTEWRRDIHRHPELGYQETRTSGLVAERLRSFGFDAVETGIGGTGVVGVLHGKSGPASGPEKAILLRADMDALPIEEQDQERPHRSTVPGAMHACGHDGHTTALLGAAKRMAETRDFDGTVYFCFQPAEEGGAGAKAMIEDGLFDRFPCSYVFGAHNWPGMPLGTFAVRPGAMLAASDKFTIRLEGRGGHAAKPDNSRDPIVAGAHLVTQAQALVSRRVDPLEPAVLSITAFHAGSTFNVIPEAAEIKGTIRSFGDATHQTLIDGLRRLVAQTGENFEMTAEIDFTANGYPSTLNHPEATAISRKAAIAVVGEDKLNDDFPPTMGAEDFAFMTRAKPGCFVFFGKRRQRRPASPDV